MKNFLMLGFVFVFGLIVSVAVAQTQTIDVPATASTLETTISTSSEQTATGSCSSSPSRCSMLKKVACMPVNLVKSLNVRTQVQQVSQVPNKVVGWVRCNRPVRSTVGRVFGRCR